MKVVFNFTDKDGDSGLRDILEGRDPSKYIFVLISYDGCHSNVGGCLVPKEKVGGYKEYKNRIRSKSSHLFQIPRHCIK